MSHSNALHAHQSLARAGQSSQPAGRPPATPPPHIADPIEPKELAIQTLIATIKNCQLPGQDPAARHLAEAFIENFYAWLLEKASASPHDEAHVNSK